MPYDTESYVHRIGRTGRAGRKGEAILFIAPRERNMLRAIERATRQVIEPMNLPTVDAVNALRIAKFKQRVTETIAKGEAAALRSVVEQLEVETGLPLIDIAAALASLSQGTTPLLLAAKTERERPAEGFAPAERPRDAHGGRDGPRGRDSRQERDAHGGRETAPPRPRDIPPPVDAPAAAARSRPSERTSDRSSGRPAGKILRRNFRAVRGEARRGRRGLLLGP